MTPRTRPEYGRVPRRTWAVPPQGARRRSNQSHSDLVARRMLDLDRGPAADAGATLAVRPQAVLADTPGERRIAAGIAERHDLVEERRQPEVRVVGEARREVRDERFERVGGDPVSYTHLRAH